MDCPNCERPMWRRRILYGAVLCRRYACVNAGCPLFNRKAAAEAGRTVAASSAVPELRRAQDTDASQGAVGRAGVAVVVPKLRVKRDR
jgi:hypothetical protein